tara:strand:- start:9909 stop:10805 length:897 start_codon:yes stop_codon:yes gene_type:complete
MENLDLDINNYELQDIFNLFKINGKFTELELKECKKKVLMSHPDKSKLPKEYFLFFLKAYKILYQIFIFKSNSNKDISIEYKSILKEETETSLVDKKSIDKFIQNDNFNENFNKIFEKHNTKNEFENKGYDNFLKSDIEDKTITDLYIGKIPPNERIQKLDLIREKSRSLVLHENIQNLDELNNFTNIDNQAPSNYSSGLFSSLPYEDLKKAHTETLIPVTTEDARKEKFSSINDLQQHRASIDSQPISIQQSNRFLAERAQFEDSQNTQRAYRLARQSEQAELIQQKFQSHFKHISN